MTPKTPKKHKQRFEHLVVSASGFEKLDRHVSDAELAGYELVSATEVRAQNQSFYTIFFKRPV